jgi:homospermidine synthase
MVTSTLPLIRRWTPRETQILLDLRDKDRRSFSNIGLILVRSKSSCISKYQQLTGIRKGRLYVPTGKRNG